MSNVKDLEAYRVEKALNSTLTDGFIRLKKEGQEIVAPNPIPVCSGVNLIHSVRFPIEIHNLTMQKGVPNSSILYTLHTLVFGEVVKKGLSTRAKRLKVLAFTDLNEEDIKVQYSLILNGKTNRFTMTLPRGKYLMLKTIMSYMDLENPLIELKFVTLSVREEAMKLLIALGNKLNVDITYGEDKLFYCK